MDKYNVLVKSFLTKVLQSAHFHCLFIFLLITVFRSVSAHTPVVAWWRNYIVSYTTILTHQWTYKFCRFFIG